MLDLGEERAFADEAVRGSAPALVGKDLEATRSPERRFVREIHGAHAPGACLADELEPACDCVGELLMVDYRPRDDVSTAPLAGAVFAEAASVPRFFSTADLGRPGGECVPRHISPVELDDGTVSEGFVISRALASSASPERAVAPGRSRGLGPFALELQTMRRLPGRAHLVEARFSGYDPAVRVLLFGATGQVGSAN